MLTAARMGLTGMMAPICIGFDEANPASGRHHAKWPTRLMHYRSFHRDHDSHPLPAIRRIYSTSRQPVAFEIGNDIPIIGIMRRRANAF
jgi:hypothetical protein